MADNKKRRRTNTSDDDDNNHLPFKNILKPDSAILETLKSFSTPSSSSSSSSKTLTLQDLTLPFSCREVSDLSLSSVQHNIESLVLTIARSILSGNGFSFDVPSRSAANQFYVPQLDRIVLKDKTSVRPFANISTVRKTSSGSSMRELRNTIYELISKLYLKSGHNFYAIRFRQIRVVDPSTMSSRR